MEFDVESFTKTYKGTSWFLDSSYFKEFLKDIKNNELIKNLIFCNDYLKFPPVVTYLKYRSDIYNTKLEKREKLALGACFGFLFKFSGLGYVDSKSVWVGDKVTDIKNASYFTK
ncbi:MAG: hypothetical protein E7602_05870 [Ruminococcaceae bacterium]|nr:hypothetical protein [Oscillospiraceae bacterium]